MPELTYLLIRIAAHIEINGPIPMGVSFIYSICIFVFVRDTHTNTHNTRTHTHKYAYTHLYNNNISHYTPFGACGARVYADNERWREESSTACKSLQLAGRDRVTGNLTLSPRRLPITVVSFSPPFLFSSCRGVHQTSGVRPCTRPPQPPRDIQYNMLLIY